MKKRLNYVCAKCGYVSTKWIGRCPDCGGWNCFEEDAAPMPSTKDSARSLNSILPTPITEIDLNDVPRLPSGSGELDRVLGGGFVHSSVVLMAGAPGIGKSSLALKVAATMASGGSKTLYVSAEESAAQIRMRADRITAISDNLFVSTQNVLEQIIASIDKLQPNFVVVDSIQTIFKSTIDSSAGNVSQIRECAADFLRVAKSKDVTIILIGHVTKDGSLAGPRVLEHLVDTVLLFEGQQAADLRILRAIKNRFGATSEIGLFEMRQEGLFDLPDASSLFLPDNPDEIGSVVLPTVEGSRALLVEIQALVAKTSIMPPRRTSDSIDVKKVQLLLAVLEKRLRLAIGNCDVFLKTAGDIKIDEPAADLPVAICLASSFANLPIMPRTVMFGEVGLAGEVRAVHFARQRLYEAKRLGFERAIIPLNNAREIDATELSIELVGVSTLREAFKVAFPRKSE